MKMYSIQALQREIVCTSFYRHTMETLINQIHMLIDQGFFLLQIRMNIFSKMIIYLNRVSERGSG